VGQRGQAGGITFYDREPSAIPASAPVKSTAVYKIGDRGPAGGIIFYVNPVADDDWRYLEAAPASTEGKSIQWAANSGNVSGTKADIGTGKQNTKLIMETAMQTGENFAAARLCDRLVSGGFDDWYLPSKVELGLMYLNLKTEGAGGFSEDWYWSSSQLADAHAWVQNFGDGFQSNNTTWRDSASPPWKGLTHRVRAIRQF
jgi:hypothetical protein